MSQLDTDRIVNALHSLEDDARVARGLPPIYRQNGAGGCVAAFVVVGVVIIGFWAVWGDKGPAMLWSDVKALAGVAWVGGIFFAGLALADWVLWWMLGAVYALRRHAPRPRPARPSLGWVIWPVMLASIAVGLLRVHAPRVVQWDTSDSEALVGLLVLAFVPLWRLWSTLTVREPSSPRT